MKGIGLILLLFLTACSSYDIHFRTWYKENLNECKAMRSRFYYDKRTQTAKCYRVPLIRKPILMFSRKYKKT